MFHRYGEPTCGENILQPDNVSACDELLYFYFKADDVSHCQIKQGTSVIVLISLILAKADGTLHRYRLNSFKADKTISCFNFLTRIPNSLVSFLTINIQRHSIQKLHKHEKAHRAIAIELQWLEHLWNHENMFETGVVRVNEY